MKNKSRKRDRVLMKTASNVAELLHVLMNLDNDQGALGVLTAPVCIRDEHGDFTVGVEMTTDGVVVFGPCGIRKQEPGSVK